MKSASHKTKGESHTPVRAITQSDHKESKSRAAASTTRVASQKESASLQWTFLTNHSHVLVILSRDPSLVLRKVALQVGITERAVQRIIADLEAAGIIEREKVGRQNHYRIRTDQSLRHPIEAHRNIGDLLALVREVPK